MNSVRESKQELDAAIRYAENAISSAKQTIESMEFRQQMAQKNYQEQTGREEALQREVAELKVQLAEREDKWDDAMNENRELRDIIDRMGDDSTGDSVTIKQLEDKVQGQYDDIVMLEREVEFYTKKYNEVAQGKGDAERRTIEQLEYDLTAKTAQANAWKKKYYDFKETLVRAGDPRVVDKPTMPVIPRDVAIAIFREGTLFGVEAACDEIQGESIHIDESEYVGDFHISFERDIDLDDHIDFDWVRSKIGDYDEGNVVANLEGLCAKNNFECRIHGIDDQEEKKND